MRNNLPQYGIRQPDVQLGIWAGGTAGVSNIADLIFRDCGNARETARGAPSGGNMRKKADWPGGCGAKDAGLRPGAGILPAGRVPQAGPHGKRGPRKGYSTLDKASVTATLRRTARQAVWTALSVPIFIKIIGIGLLVTSLFGAVSFYQLRTGMLRTHYQIHGETALSLAVSLAGKLEPLVRAGDESGMNVEVTRTMGEFPDVRYIVVQGREGQILSHGFTFPKEAPADLLGNEGDLCAACHAAISPLEVPANLLELQPQARLSTGHLRAYTRRGGMIMEVGVPVGDGERGSVRLGVGDRIIMREMASITRSLMWSLVVCVLIGISMASYLSYVLVRPIRGLLQATLRLKEGDFSARSPDYPPDEIGHLANGFNQMAAGLEEYRRKVAEKEEARQMLLGKIVRAQEDERKHVARELHDQLGQMLSKTLLTIETGCGGCEKPKTHCPEIRQDIRDMIDEVRQLAWNVRPAILDDYGLDQALARYIRETGKRVGFALDYQSVIPEGEGRIAPPEVEVALYRIAQEAVTNIIRHANATEASVILVRRGGEIMLMVEDNGSGFEFSAQQSRQTLGLMGMRERAALVGGELTIESNSGTGTTIRVRIPLNTNVQ